jgi:arylsulfatase A-like enzyme
MMSKTKTIGLLLALIGLLPPAMALTEKPNVLFIAVDDLNDWVGFLGGHPNTKTPNLDELASRGVSFTNAYTVSPICGPSRASVLTGMRPETTGVYHNKGMYKDYVADAVALPKFLKDNGYHVMGAGKINHAMGMVVPENYHDYGPDAGAIGGPFTWQELSLTPGKKVQRKDILGKTLTEQSGIVKDVYPNKEIKRGTLAATLPLNGIDNTLDRPFNGYNTFDWGPVNVSDNEMPDGKIAQWATEKLTEKYTKPFFLALGFYRPHQPFYVPKKYFDAFAGETIELPKVQRNDLSDLSETARQYAHFPWSGSFDRVQKHNAWQSGVLAYLAAIHFADAQVGRVLNALEKSQYKDNTLIVLWSDHGWELGEKEHWGKHSPWEGSTRVPFIIVPPKSASLKKGAHASFASLLDIYPTIADYAQLPIPENLEGKSLKNVIAGEQEKVRDYNITTLGRASYALRFKQWKFIHYYDGSEELYDLSKDANEWHNLAKLNGYQSKLVQFRKMLPLDAHFKQLIRYNNFKAIITAQGEFQLYNMQDAKSGIGEQDEVAKNYPDIVAKIQQLLKAQNITVRYVDLSNQHKT